jgi:hypothetical protein
MTRPTKRRFTDKMEAFCLAYMETGNATEAYRRSYNIENMIASSVGREAWIVLQKPQVQARIAELREVVMERHSITVDTLLAELEEARAMAIKSSQVSAAVSATMGKAKLLGLDKKIVEITGKNGGAIETSSKVTVDKKAFESVLDRL